MENTTSYDEIVSQEIDSAAKTLRDNMKDGDTDLNRKLAVAYNTLLLAEHFDDKVSLEPKRINPRKHYVWVNILSLDDGKVPWISSRFSPRGFHCCISILIFNSANFLRC